MLVYYKWIEPKLELYLGDFMGKFLKIEPDNTFFLKWKWNEHTFFETIWNSQLKRCLGRGDIQRKLYDVVLPLIILCLCGPSFWVVFVSIHIFLFDWNTRWKSTNRNANVMAWVLHQEGYFINFENQCLNPLLWLNTWESCVILQKENSMFLQIRLTN